MDSDMDNGMNNNSRVLYTMFYH